MERALDEQGIPFDTLNYVSGTAGRSGILVTPHGAKKPVPAVDAGKILSADRTCVCRLNGPVLDDYLLLPSYSITEEDNIDWIGSFERTLPKRLDLAIRSKRLLSLGHSAGDWSQRAMLRPLNKRSRLVKGAMAISLNPSPKTVMTWQRYEVDFYNLDLNEWAARMSEPA